MGLDTVELIMAIEERFGIEIPDKEASEMRTVGDMQRFILSKVNVSDEKTCMTQQAFHLIRRTAISAFGVSRRTLKPDTLLDSFIPKKHRFENWVRFQSSLGVMQMPGLVRPAIVVATLTLLVLAVLVAAFWYGAVTGTLGMWFLIGSVAAIAVGWAGEKATDKTKTQFQKGYARVRDLARYIVARHPELLQKPRLKTLTEEEVRCILREVIIEETTVTEFNDNSRFVADLHLD